MPKTNPNQPQPVVVLLAHGSRADTARLAHEDLCARLSDATGSTVRPAFLELCGPSLPDTLDELADGGAAAVLLVPHFLAPGNHVLRDVPELVASAREQHPAMSITVTPHLGADPGLVDLLEQTIERAANSLGD